MNLNDSQNQNPNSPKLTQRIGCRCKDSFLFILNGIAFNTAACSSFAIIIEESMKFARQWYPLQCYKEPDQNKFGSAASAKAQLDWSCAYIALQGKGWYSSDWNSVGSCCKCHQKHHDGTTIIMSIS